MFRTVFPSIIRSSRLYIQFGDCLLLCIFFVIIFLLGAILFCTIVGLFMLLKRGRIVELESVFFLVQCYARFLLSRLKTCNCRRHLFSLRCFMFIFMYILIRHFIVCTVPPFIIPSSEVLFLLFRSIIVCSICKFMREFQLNFKYVQALLFQVSLVVIGWSSTLVFSNAFTFG